jgi:threonylcarbamoyladenosine tRNA methylthiotransferase MtaB
LKEKTSKVENYVKIRKPWTPYLVNQLHQVTLDEIDEEGFMRASLVPEGEPIA